MNGGPGNRPARSSNGGTDASSSNSPIRRHASPRPVRRSAARPGPVGGHPGRGGLESARCRNRERPVPVSPAPAPLHRWLRGGSAARRRHALLPDRPARSRSGAPRGPRPRSTRPPSATSCLRSWVTAWPSRPPRCAVPPTRNWCVTRSTGSSPWTWSKHGWMTSARPGSTSRPGHHANSWSHPEPRPSEQRDHPLAARTAGQQIRQLTVDAIEPGESTAHCWSLAPSPPRDWNRFGQG